MNRDLGGSERFYWIANQWSPNNVVAVCSIAGTLELPRLAQALALLRTRHPALGLVVRADASGRVPRFVRKPGGRIRLNTEARSADGFADAVEANARAALNARIDPAHELAQLTYLHTEGESALVLTCLHVIADATAVLVALRDLLAQYAALSRDPTPKVAALTARPAFDALLPRQLRGLRGVRAVLRTQTKVALEALAARPARLLAERDAPLPERTNGLIRRTLAPERLAALKRACTREGVTIHGVLTAALALATAEELGLRARPRQTLNVGSPVSFRNRMTPPIGDELGSWVATLPLLLEVGAGQTLWQVARTVNSQLARKKARDEELAMMRLADWITPGSYAGSARFVALAEREGPGNLCISNIGAFAFPTEVCGLAVRDVHWAASLSATGYFLCAVCSTELGLALDFTFFEQAVSPARALRVIERMDALLETTERSS